MTLKANSVARVSHTFAEGIQGGLVGLGLEDAHTEFDDVAAGAHLLDDFRDGDAEGWTPSGGEWLVEQGLYAVYSAQDEEAQLSVWDASMSEGSVAAKVRTQQWTGHSNQQREANLTPYRVITDHARAAAFLIADGVVPGNTGRNYVSRMIIRRAARFGSLIGLDEPFLAQVARSVIDNYGDFFHELDRNQNAILDNLTREEVRFQKTVEAGISKLDAILEETEAEGLHSMPGEAAFDLYATYGLPLEITRDIAGEHNIEVEDRGFHAAMEQHRIASGASSRARSPTRSGRPPCRTSSGNNRINSWGCGMPKRSAGM